MNNLKQEVCVYDCYLYQLAEYMREYIEQGWRVHTCLERHGAAIVIYEKALEN